MKAGGAHTRRQPYPCRFRGGRNGTARVPICCGTISVTTYACERFGACTLRRKAEGKPTCRDCREREEEQVRPPEPERERIPPAPPETTKQT